MFGKFIIGALREGVLLKILSAPMFESDIVAVPAWIENDHVLDTIKQTWAFKSGITYSNFGSLNRRKILLHKTRLNRSVPTFEQTMYHHDILLCAWLSNRPTCIRIK